MEIEQEDAKENLKQNEIQQPFENNSQDSQKDNQSINQSQIKQQNIENLIEYKEQLPQIQIEREKINDDDKDFNESGIKIEQIGRIKNDKEDMIISLASQNEIYNQELMDNPLLATSNSNGQIQIIDMQSEYIKTSFKLFKNYIPSLQFLDTNHLLATESSDLHILDIEYKRKVRSYQGHDKTLLVSDFNQFRNLILTAGYDKTIMLWDQRIAKPVNCILAHAKEITSLQFSDDSTNILSTSYDGFTRIWSTYTGLCQKTICVDNSSTPSYSKFSPNGRFVLLSTLRNLITLWDWRTISIVDA
ncbi:WD40-repeat-containing domain [Pseudocohnilembus persalinus]|uniref:WD40-repeat-containing domain n=1 Tax=Pseudocohnilembus persalinus TaxID=266149 RepID=A0A0V0QJ01_PSEPJ|nr:WD40-repeat-containing domain [Pseudocohnilembus persalinus]|eukprot:KRX02271.1 WD40-repeat-containing domain [Pseudocohnilembus persalinus]